MTRAAHRSSVDAALMRFERERQRLWQLSGAAIGRLRIAVEASQSPRSLAALPAGEASPSASEPPPEAPAFDLALATERLIDDIAARGFVYEPWQIAAFITALRTKPFVILAGVSGTGKSRLPRLVADATGCAVTLIPVRPDWSDSSDVIGYTDLQGRFQPGPLLRAASHARADLGRQHLFVLDEMNLAKVEHYLAEVLSRIEQAVPAPLVTAALSPEDARWGTIGIPATLAIVGTVNMDETAHGFSRRVLDRAFTLELSEIDLRAGWDQLADATAPRTWPIAAWSAPVAHDRAILQQVAEVLVEANAILGRAQLQVGYRTRDEVVGFVSNAAAVAASFVTRRGKRVAPLDLALWMKLLPRIAGAGEAIRDVLRGLVGFATDGRPYERCEQADAAAERWRASGCDVELAGARFPRTAARLCLMWGRLVADGFTSFWL